MVIQNKKELRKDFKKVVTNLDPRWIEAASHAVGREITSVLREKAERRIEHLLCFAAFFPGEVDLTNFISEQLELRRVYLPILHQDGKMTFISIESDWRDAATSGAFGIAEPTADTGVPYDPEHAAQTAVIVPGLVFDKFGNRLGRGKGYYDRFLAQRRHRNMLKIGVCWGLQLIDEVPSESHDVSMDWVCHERGAEKTAAEFEDES